ncbi:MAG: hypothetical protein JXR66_03550 [Bacteroidales bacterium]|nr:hypothetical protein [Bacteroidales bacterium]MBN2632605.1 hypothetical protein [Bacteroidales bacterium]
MRYLTLFLLMVLLAGMPSCKFFKDKKIFGKKKAELEALQEQQRKIREADSLKAVEERLRVLEQARLDSMRLAEEERLALATRYNIVVGAFITPEYAREWVEEYRNRGYDPTIIPFPGTSFELVVAEAHPDAAKAFSRLNQFLDTVQIDAWVYERK